MVSENDFQSWYFVQLPSVISVWAFQSIKIALEFPVNLIRFQFAYRILVFSMESEGARLLEVTLFWPIAMRKTLHIIKNKKQKRYCAPKCLCPSS